MSTSAAIVVSVWPFQASYIQVLGLRTELVHAEDQDGLVDLESQKLGLHQRKRLSVDLDKSFTGL